MKYRHGDVGIKPSSAPPHKDRIRLNHLILAEGEVTGHYHRVVSVDGSPAKDDAELVLSNGQLFLRAKKPVAVIHQEHARIQLPKGWYRIIQQREWSPEGARMVVD